MAIDWTAISTITEVISVIMIVASLFYVAVQVRQNTNAMLSSSRQGLLNADLELISTYMSYSIDPHLIRDDVELTLEDERRFIWLLVKTLRIREFAWHEYKSGNLDEKTWLSYMAPMSQMFSTNRSKAVLQFYTGSPEFKEMLKSMIPSGDGQVRQETLDLITSLNLKQSKKNKAKNK